MLRDVIAEVPGRGDAITQVVLIERLLHADCDGFQVASSQAAVGGIAFGQNEQVLLLLRQQIVVRAEKAANVGHSVLLRGHGAAVA